MWASAVRHRYATTPAFRMCSPEVRGTRGPAQLRKLSIRHAKGDDTPDGSKSDVESLFAKELAKRGISGSSIDDSGSSPEAPARSSPPPQLAQKEATPSETPQLDRSRALNSEGLEGLIPRASILLRLGGSFFLGFVPFILLVSALFVGLYVGFGDQFIHTGTSSSALPQYVDPYELLNEPTVDPYFPINN